MTLLISCILLLIAFVFKGIMDKSAKDGYRDSFWNKSQSWENKYAKPLEKGKDWWYFWNGKYLFKQTHKEAFPFSSTALVFLTDGWHLAQFFFLNCMFVALSLNVAVGVYAILLAFVTIRFIYLIGFSIGYK